MTKRCESAGRALREGYVLPCASMGGFAETISGVIPADAAKSRLYAPFAAERPATLSAADWAALQAPGEGADRRRCARRLCQASRLVPERICAPLREGGRHFGAAERRRLLQLADRPDDHHRPDRRRDPRARAVAKSSASGRTWKRSPRGPASPPARPIIADLRTNPKYYAKTPEELMQYVAREAKKIDGQMPELFATLAAPSLRDQGDPAGDRARHDHRLL